MEKKSVSGRSDVKRAKLQITKGDQSDKSDKKGDIGNSRFLIHALATIIPSELIGMIFSFIEITNKTNIQRDFIYYSSNAYTSRTVTNYLHENTEEAETRIALFSDRISIYNNMTNTIHKGFGGCVNGLISLGSVIFYCKRHEKRKEFLKLHEDEINLKIIDNDENYKNYKKFIEAENIESIFGESKKIFLSNIWWLDTVNTSNRSVKSFKEIHLDKFHYCIENERFKENSIYFIDILKNCYKGFHFIIRNVEILEELKHLLLNKVGKIFVEDFEKRSNSKLKKIENNDVDEANGEIVQDNINVVNDDDDGIVENVEHVEPVENIEENIENIEELELVDESEEHIENIVYDEENENVNERNENVNKKMYCDPNPKIELEFKGCKGNLERIASNFEIQYLKIFNTDLCDFFSKIFCSITILDIEGFIGTVIDISQLKNLEVLKITHQNNKSNYLIRWGIPDSKKIDLKLSGKRLNSITHLLSRKCFGKLEILFDEIDPTCCNPLFVYLFQNTKIDRLILKPEHFCSQFVDVILQSIERNKLIKVVEFSKSTRFSISNIAILVLLKNRFVHYFKDIEKYSWGNNFCKNN
jgi:hypothetical protein